MTEWRDALVRWRCGLPLADRQSYGMAARMDCHDLKFFVGRINFEQLGAQRASALNSIPTRFRLSQEQVGTLISAGQDALRTHAMFHAFLNSIRGKLLTAASSATR
jgi:NTE family protein